MTRASASRAYPWQMLDENKWLAARHGLDGELVDLPSSDRIADEGPRAPAPRPPARARRRPRARPPSSTAVEDLLARGNGAARQIVVYEANHDLREVMAEIVEATGA